MVGAGPRSAAARLGRAARGAGERHGPPQHIDEDAGDRQVRPGRIGGDVEQDDQAAPAPRRGHQRRAVGERCPGAFRQLSVRLGQHLARDRHVVGHREIVERPFAREAAELLRLLPGKRAAEHAAAAPQPHRHEIVVVGRRQARPGEADQHAALVDPARQPLARSRHDGADVGKHQQRDALIDETVDRFARRSALGDPHVGERPERARQIIGRRQQRLRRIGGGARDHADRPAPPALVEQLHGARGALAQDFEPRDIVADLDRQIETRFGFGRGAGELEGRVAERQPAQIARAHDAASGRGWIGAQHFHRKRARRVVGGYERERAGDAAVHRHDPVARDLLQFVDERRAVAEIDAVAEPHHREIAVGAQQARKRR